MGMIKRKEKGKYQKEMKYWGIIVKINTDEGGRKNIRDR